MMKKRRYLPIAAIAAVALVAAACSSGGDGDQTSVAPPVEPPVEPPTYTVDLPDGHGLTPGRTTLVQGDTMAGDTTINCPSMDGCVLTVSRDPVTGVYTATATGGVVTVAVFEPPVGPDPALLAAAQDAAMEAWQAARDALAGLADMKNANPAAYQRAENYVDDAEAAYKKAAAAATVAEAERQRDLAVAASMDATTQAAIVVASYEAPALKTAQMAAKSAADAAKMAHDEAKAALAAVESIKAVDMASYGKARAKVDAAETAYNTAKAASDDAAATTVLADAEASQEAAEDQLDAANAANTGAMKYAGMVQTAETDALSAAKTAAQTAYDAAKTAYDAAAKRVEDLEAKKADNVEDHVRATDALVPVKAAHDKAKKANDLAQAATTSVDAESHQAKVETEKQAVDTSKGDVDRYAELVEKSYMSAQAARDAEDKRKNDVAAASTAAMNSYQAAETDAMKAEAAADAAEAGSPGSPGAMAARTAATAARTAATAAKTAHDAITADMTKAEADAKADDAASAAGTANTAYKTAKAENDAIQTIIAVQIEEQRLADIKAAKGAVTAAKAAKDAAAKFAGDAEQARDDAKAEYDRTTAARTNTTEAEAQYEAAKVAATKARTAAAAANTAYMAAMTAAEGIDDATADEAKTARTTAEAEQKNAETQSRTAETQYTAANTAAMAAMSAANTHVLELFKQANAYDIKKASADKTVAQLRQEKIDSADGIGEAIAGAAGEGDGKQIGLATVSAAWTADKAAGPDGITPATPGLLEIKIQGLSVKKTLGITSDTVGEDNNNDGDTADKGDEKPNASTIAGVGEFDGFDIYEDASDGKSKVRVIAFTDREQAVDKVAAVSAKIATDIKTDGGTVTKIGARSGNTYTGVEFRPHGDAAPLTGTLTCPKGQSCTVTVGTKGEIEISTGFTFTGSRAGKAEVPKDEGFDYLLFGLWLDDDTTTNNKDSFGAFGMGGEAFKNNSGQLKDLTGTASYSGEAVGAHHKTGSAVSWFEGDARLTAKFGADDEEGTIDGSISNISVNGGEAMSTPINLVETKLNTVTFNNDAVMGAPKVVGKTATYPFNGTWSGGFFNNPTGKDLKGDALHPGSVAGTFGVTRTDDMGTTSGADFKDDDVTESFVGAFGAHKN